MAVDRNSPKYFHQRVGSLRLERESFIKHYRDLSEFTQPRKGRFTKEDRNRGAARHSSIINSVATQALRIATAGLFAGVMSPARPWLVMEVAGDPDVTEFGPAKEWLHVVTRLIRDDFLRTNIYNMAPVMFGDMLLFATGCMTKARDAQTGSRYYTHAPGSYMIAQNDRMEVDTIVREFQMTVDQMVKEFGLDNVSQDVRNLWDNGNYDAWRDVVHFVEPNPDFDSRKILSRFKRYRSVKYEPGNLQKANTESKFLSRAGHDRFPGYVPRWEKTGEDIYGTNCPGMVALGDTKGLQTEERRKAQGIDKMVNPPLKGPASLRGANVSSLPGGITIYDGGGSNEKLEPLYRVEPNLQELRADMDKVEGRIKEAFFVDLFLAITEMDGIQPRNELELSQRNQERLLQLGPPLGQIQEEFLSDLVADKYEDMAAAGLLPPPPAELENSLLKIGFVSALAVAQRAVATGGLNRLTVFTGELRNMGYEEALDKVNPDQAIDEYASAIGVSPRVIRSDAEVAEIRTARAEAQQEAERQQQALASVQVGAAAARDMSDAVNKRR